MSLPTVFVSYSHADEIWKDRLVSHLSVLQGIEVWDDRQIDAGEEWWPAIETALESADVAVLLISADFLNSDFIRRHEVPALLRRRSSGSVRVIPLVVRPCVWGSVNWLAALQVRPLDGRPLSAGGENQIETNLAALAQEIHDLVYKKAGLAAEKGAPNKSLKRSTSQGKGSASGSRLSQVSKVAWLSGLAALIVLVWMAVDLYRASPKTILCDDGTTRLTIDIRDFVTQFSGYSVELEAQVGTDKISGKLDPKALQELTDSLQQMAQFHRFVVAGYNACAISKREYSTYGGRYQALDALARQISALAAREYLSEDEGESLSELVNGFSRMAQQLMME